MPTGVGVVDAFKNLIRHGKNHHHAKDRDSDSSTPSQTSDQPRTSAHQPDRQQQQQQQREQKRQRDVESPTAAVTQPATREAAEMIVSEEREAKNKMPTYKGLENFKLIEKMGDGAFSNVYKAIDLKTGSKVAVKVVRKYELNASQRANILKEVQIMRGTNHPSIVKLISFSESPEYYFLVLELMQGGELFHQIVKLTYFSEALSRHVILQVAQGIRYLHEERGVVHRDIKPENLLFEPIPIIPSKTPIRRPYDEEKEDEGDFVPGVGGGGIGRVKIADFGLSKVVWNEETMTPCGTVGYTAPEIVKDERYSKSVDMWALGCVLYTLLCGFPPFYDESINVLTEKVARGYYTFLSPWWDDISHSAKDLISHLLCVDPVQRYTIDEFLAHPWCNAALAPMPPPTPQIGASRPLDSPLLTAAHGGLIEARSPGLASLKEAFDITYAVHRMEEEGRRRRRGGGASGARAFLAGLNEDDEDDENAQVEEARQKHGDAVGRALEEGQARMRQQQAQQQAQQAVAGEGARAVAKRHVEQEAYDGRAGQRDRGRRDRASRGFELDMDNATLLGRRHKRQGGGPIADLLADGSPLSRKPASVSQDDADVFPPGSPMRVG